MNFLYMGDMHESFKPPESRIEALKDEDFNGLDINYKWNETLTRKVNEIRDIAKYYNVKAILHGGDFLSSPKYGTDSLVKILNRWGYKIYNEKLLEEGALTNKFNEPPLVGPVGNHEMFGYSMKNYDKTSLHFLEQIGFVTIPSKEEPLVFHEDGYTVAITASNYSKDMDVKKDAYIVEEKKGNHHIHIVHGMLTKGKYFEDAPHTRIDEILHTKADLTISAHDHSGFKLVTHEDKMFVNSGAILRGKSSEKNRKPKVMLVQVTKDGGIKVKDIYLKSALPGEEVFFKDDEEDFKKQRKDSLKIAKEKISGGVDGLSNINDIIKTIAENKQTDEDVTQRVIAKVVDKIEKSKTDNITDENLMSEEPYHVTKLVLNNFASHKYSEFEFSKGLNVFIGETGSGKTTIFRAFRWLYDDFGSTKRFIKRGASEASVKIYTSNGYIITRFASLNKKGNIKENGYEIIYPDGKVEKLNTKGNSVIKGLLSYLKLDLENKKIDLNFLPQGNSWFFIGDAFTSGDRAKIIGSIYKTHFADLVIKDLEADSRKITSEKEKLAKELERLDKQIKEYDYLDEMEGYIKELDKLQGIVTADFSKLQNIQSLEKKKSTYEESISKCETILDKLQEENINTLDKSMHSLNSNFEKAKNIIPKIKKLTENEEKIKETQITLDKLPDDFKLLNFAENLSESSLNVMQIEKICTVKNNLDKTSFKICNLENLTKKLNQYDVDSSNDLLNSIGPNLDKINHIFTSQKKLNSVLYKGRELKKVISKLDEINIEALEQSLDSTKVIAEKIPRVLSGLNKLGQVMREGVAKKQEIASLDTELKKEAFIYKTLLLRDEHCPVCNSKITSSIADDIIKNKFNI